MIWTRVGLDSANLDSIILNTTGNHWQINEGRLFARQSFCFCSHKWCTVAGDDYLLLSKSRSISYLTLANDWAWFWMFHCLMLMSLRTILLSLREKNQIMVVSECPPWPLYRALYMALYSGYAIMDECLIVLWMKKLWTRNFPLCTLKSSDYQNNI